MRNINIVPVTSRKELNTFIKLPWKLYKGNPNWSAPLLYDRKKILDTKKNPFYKHASIQLYLAYEGNEVTGRIAAIINDLHNECHNEKAGFFGFFECINDQETANKLFNSAREWIKAKGMDLMRGPANPSSNDDWGMLIEGFDVPPMIMMPYNYEYYNQLCVNYGLTKIKDLFAYRFDEEILKSEKMKRVIDIVKTRSKVKISCLDMKHYEGELEKIKFVYNNAWAPNWGFVPLTDEEIDALAADLKPLIKPSLVLFGEVDGKVAGFSLSVPDYNYIFNKINGRLFPFGFIRLFTLKKEIKWFRIITLGIIPEFHKKGLDALFYWEIYQNALKLGMKSCEASWILENNEMMNNAIVNAGGIVYKKYRIYQINI